MSRRKIQTDASGTVQGTWDPDEPTFPPGSHQGTLHVDGGPPVPVSFTAAYVVRMRLRVLDIHWRDFFWFLVFWRGFRQSGRPALELSLWRAGRHSWLHFWQWETDPDATGMEVTAQAIPPDEPECTGCRMMGQAGLSGECVEPGCNVIH